MIFFQSLKEALLSIKANMVRSLLTMLGIIIGIASVSTLTGIGEGFKQVFSGQVNSLGANIVFVAPGDVSSMTSGGGGGEFSSISQIVSSTLSDKDVTAIKNLPATKAITPMSLVGGVTRNGSTVTKTSFTAGFTPDVFTIFESKVETGRLFTDEDNVAKAKVAVLTKKAKDILFPTEDPVGKKLTVFEKDFTVIGVLQDKPQKSSSTFSSGFDDVVFIPVQTAWDITSSKNILRMVAQATSADQVNPLKDQISAALMQTHQTKDFSVLTQEDLVGVLNTVFDTLSKAILGITAISLIVGGIGIMNIMLVSVTERTREIGLRKAVGATGFTILIQFIAEAIVLSLLGGIIGYAASLGAGALASQALGFTAPITVKAIMLAFGVSIGVGVVFGVAPAIRAARKHPIEALRYE